MERVWSTAGFLLGQSFRGELIGGQHDVGPMQSFRAMYRHCCCRSSVDKVNIMLAPNELPHLCKPSKARWAMSCSAIVHHCLFVAVHKFKPFPGDVLCGEHDVKLLSHDLGYLFPHLFLFPRFIFSRLSNSASIDVSSSLTRTRGCI